MLGVAPSVLLAKLADSDNTSSSDDDDEGRVYEAKFAELFDAPCTVPKVKAYVSIVRTYSDKAVRTKIREFSSCNVVFFYSFAGTSAWHGWLAMTLSASALTAAIFQGLTDGWMTEYC